MCRFQVDSWADINEEFLLVKPNYEFIWAGSCSKEEFYFIYRPFGWLGESRSGLSAVYKLERIFDRATAAQNMGENVVEPIMIRSKVIILPLVLFF